MLITHEMNNKIPLSGCWYYLREYVFVADFNLKKKIFMLNLKAKIYCNMSPKKYESIFNILHE